MSASAPCLQSAGSTIPGWNPPNSSLLLFTQQQMVHDKIFQHHSNTALRGHCHWSGYWSASTGNFRSLYESRRRNGIALGE
eukprot:3303269-Ditylum_brightwellii.AAC.1